MKKLDPVIKHFGSQSSLAEALGVTQVAVHFWVRQDALPSRRAIEVERLTDGELKARDLVEVQDE